MSVVSLVSGGLDSTLMSLLIKREKIEQYPLFINYGQISSEREKAACLRNFRRLKLPKPTIMDISGFGGIISSGLTDRRKRVFEDAFTPGRNLMFLLMGASFAYQRGAAAVSIGLLSEASSIFFDQTRAFISQAENTLSAALDRPLKVLTPLMGLTKADVIRLARRKGIDQTYSCHAGAKFPCGTCVACREFASVES